MSKKTSSFFENAEINYNYDPKLVPLIETVRQGHIPTVALMIKDGADLDKRDTNGFTALSVACMNNNIEMATLLINAGARAFIPDYQKRTPLFWAQKHKNSELIQLIEGAIASVLRPTNKMA